MHSIVAVALCAVFVVLAGWHFRMAVSPPRRAKGAVPSVDGTPLFAPPPAATAAVGAVLLGFAGLIVVAAGWLTVDVPHAAVTWACGLLALGLLARAVGEFRYVGFFKRVRDSRFARRDTWLYSPLCLLLSIGVAVVAVHRGA